MAISETRIRTGERGDLARITEIYNYYILNTPVTFDVEPYTVERREAWLAQFSATGRASADCCGGQWRSDGICRDDAVSPQGRI